MSAKASGNVELAKKYLRMAKVSCVILLYPVLQYCISKCSAPQIQLLILTLHKSIYLLTYLLNLCV